MSLHPAYFPWVNEAAWWMGFTYALVAQHNSIERSLLINGMSFVGKRDNVLTCACTCVSACGCRDQQHTISRVSQRSPSFSRVWLQIIQKLTHIMLPGVSIFVSKRYFCWKWQWEESRAERLMCNKCAIIRRWDTIEENWEENKLQISHLQP